MKPEILAPVGDFDMLTAAVRCGADAVYLGAKQMNARRNAGNFDFEQLKNAVRYCHSHNVKVYLTLNTLTSDSEMKMAYETAGNALEIGADAFIIQDLGTAKMIKDCFPSARLHASTQCSIMTPKGFEMLENMGFSRVVIPREMSLDEIKDIRNSTGMELELFVHGALCMCVSGQCYMSAMLGGRSGNRGLCAQPCRLKFSSDGSDSCDLSLKDLSLISHLREIQEAGIASLKIEGRMKRPEYVAAAVTAYKKSLEGNYTDGDEHLLKSVFSRSGFTDGYFTGRQNDMFGKRSKEDVTAAAGVLKDLSRLYEKEKQTVKINFDFTVKEGRDVVLTAKTDKKEAIVTIPPAEKAINKPLTKQEAEERISKLGGTQYFAGSVNTDIDDGLRLTASQINELRRRAVELLDEEKIEICEKLPFTQIQERKSQAVPYSTAEFINPDTIPENHPFKRIFIPVYSKDEDFIKHGAGAILPRGLFGAEKRVKNRLTQLKQIGVTKILASNTGGYALAESMGFEVYGGFGLNVFNSITAGIFKSPILSYELTLNQANAVNAKDTGIIAYGKLPLMLTRNCPVKHRIGCEECKKQGKLTDRKGYEFPVVCSPYPCVEILNPLPLYMADRLEEIHTDFIHFCFTDEDKAKVQSIINAYKKRLPSTEKFTRGLYYRGVK